jgi:hypothetical protein
MNDYYRFLASYEALIYILLAVGGLFTVRWLWNSWREWRRAVYQLEREFALRRLSQSAAVTIIIIVMACSEFFMASFIIPGLPAETFLSTPTLDLLAVPSGTLSSGSMTQFAALPAPVTQPATGCVPGQVMLSSPEPAAEIVGQVDLIGTVDLPNFGFYKYEVAPQGSDTWVSLGAGREVVHDGLLGRWDTTAAVPGDYQLRLVVTDNQGVAAPACIVPVRIKAGE